MNLSSVLIWVKPGSLASVVNNIKKSDLCEYHLDDENGKIIVTIEGENLEEEIKLLKKIRDMENVLNAEVMYSYSEDELDQLRTDLESNETLPSWLNDKNSRAEDIRYNGDLKKRIL